MVTVSTAAIHERLDAIFAERDRLFPRRDPENTRAMHAALAEYATALRAARDPAWRPDAELVARARAILDAPVVICGFMKSGTTLLLDLLDGHPELHVLPEEPHMVDAGVNGRRRVEREAYCIPFLVNPRGQTPFWFLGQDDAPYLDFLGYFDAALAVRPGDDRDVFLAFVEAVYCANPRRAPRPRAWVEKTPENEFHVDAILGWFPRARFVHIVRHPFENFAALTELQRNRAAWRPKPWTMPNTARKLATSVAAARENRRRLGAGRYHVVRYEDLAETGPRMRGIARFLGIEWDETLLTPTMNGAPTQPNSMDAARRGHHGRVAIEPVGRWRTRLTPAERAVARLLLSRAVRRWAAL